MIPFSYIGETLMLNFCFNWVFYMTHIKSHTLPTPQVWIASPTMSKPMLEQLCPN